MLNGSTLPVDQAKQLSAKVGLAATGRVGSVDVLRGLTILLMVWVNDLGPGAPAWMHHIEPSNADGMTLADVVFPVFLFLVGMSIPLAFERAEAAGKSTGAQILHILLRSVPLLFMGVIELNRGYDATLGYPLWGVLAYSALILAWCVLPRNPGWKRYAMLGVKGIGLLVLVVLLVVYRRKPESADIPVLGLQENWTWLQTGWWGILGLIGWAYLTVGLLVLVLGRRREWLMGAMALLMVLHLALNHGGLFTRLETKPWLASLAGPMTAISSGVQQVQRFVSLRDATGSLAAITMAGCLLGSILRRDSDVVSLRARLGWAATFAVGLFIAGLLTDTFEGINKIAATPTWCLCSAAIACVVWMIIYLIQDGAGVALWSVPLRAAGANPLVAYFLHPIVVGLLSLTGLGEQVLAYRKATEASTVVLGSLAMSLSVCLSAGLLGRLGLRMKL